MEFRYSRDSSCEFSMHEQFMSQGATVTAFRLIVPYESLIIRSELLDWSELTEIKL